MASSQLQVRPGEEASLSPDAVKLNIIQLTACMAGESVLNDAVAIVLFRTLEDYHATPMTLHMIPRMIGRFLVIGIGSLICGVAPPILAVCLSCLAKGSRS